MLKDIEVAIEDDLSGAMRDAGLASMVYIHVALTPRRHHCTINGYVSLWRTNWRKTCL